LYLFFVFFERERKARAAFSSCFFNADVFKLTFSAGAGDSL
jgi:hypothetical protein